MTSAVHKKALKNARNILPITKAGGNGNRGAHIPASHALRGEETRSSAMLVTDAGAQQNCIPALKYFSRGPLLKLPVPEQAKCRNSSEKSLAGKKLASLDTSLHPDRVSGPTLSSIVCIC